MNINIKMKPVYTYIYTYIGYILVLFITATTGKSWTI